MEYILLISSFIITLIALIGNTWNSHERGINKLNIKGKIAFLASIAILSTSINSQYYKNIESTQLKFDTHESIAVHAWEIEMLVEKIEQMNFDEKKLTYIKHKLELLAKQLARIIQTHTKSFTADEINRIEQLILFVENELLKLNTDISTTEIMTSLTDLTFNSRELRKDFCKSMIEKSYFCFERQGVNGIHFWDLENDIKMKNAINNARISFNEILKNFDKLEKNNLAIKVPINLHDGTNEHVWLKNITYEDGLIIGVINNYLTGETLAKKGDILLIEPKFISDWKLIKEDKVYGNFTVYVVLERMSKKEKEDFINELNYVLPPAPISFKF